MSAERALSRGTRLRGKLFLVAVLLVAFALRAARASEGLPYLHHWDEPHVAGRAANMVISGDFNPHWFQYGTLTIYMHAAVDALHFLWLCAQPEEALVFARSLADLQTWPDEQWRYAITNPSFYAWNRVLTAILGTGSVFFAWGLAREVLGRAWALAAALFLAALPIHVEHSALVTSDVPAGFFALGAVLASMQFAREARAGTFVLALALTGLAAAVKYNAAVVLCVPVAALLVSLGRVPAAERPWLGIAVPVVPAIAFVLAMPCALLDWKNFLDHAGGELTHYRVAGHGAFTVAPGWPHVRLQISSFAAELGWPSLAAALAGLFMVWRKPRGVLVVLFPLAYFLLMTRMRVSFHRNFVPLYPFLAIGLAACAERIAALSGGLRARWARPVFVGLVSAALLVQLAATASISRSIAASRETRSSGVDLLERLAREQAWTRVGISLELHVHESDLRRLSVPFEVAPLAALVARAGEFDALLAAAEHETKKGTEEIHRWNEEELDRLALSLPCLARIEGAPLELPVSADPGLLVLDSR